MDVTNPLVRKLEHRSPISAEEREILLRSVSKTRDVAADQDIVFEGSKPSESTLLLSGFAARYKSFADGRRQILAIHVAGDFVDLHSFLLNRMDHGIFALCPSKIANVSHVRLFEITEKHPHLTRQLWLSTLIDAAIHREWMIGMGRRSALAKISHLMCELFIRLAIVGQTNGFRFSLPVTQDEMADSLGMSVVHLNRTLQELRNGGLITWRRTNVVIDDWKGLLKMGEFDPTYLNLKDDFTAVTLSN